MHEEACYKRSYLTEVIAKIDFATPIEKLEKNVPPKVVSAFVEKFPIVEPQETVMQEILFEGEDVKGKKTNVKQWNYFSKDRSQQLTLAASSVFIQLKTYENYEVLYQLFESVVTTLNSAFPGIMASRFGLRYINQLDIQLEDPTRWDKYIVPELLSRSFFGNGDAISRLMSIAEIKYDEVSVRFQFGMPNPDYPAELKRPLYVLDLDASVVEAHPIIDTLDYVNKGHARIQDIFERSITANLRARMND